jgi:hypothetical protein
MCMWRPSVKAREWSLSSRQMNPLLEIVKLWIFYTWYGLKWSSPYSKSCPCSFLLQEYLSPVLGEISEQGVNPWESVNTHHIIHHLDPPVTSCLRISTITNLNKIWNTEAPGEQTDKAKDSGSINGSINGHLLCLGDWPKAPLCLCVRQVLGTRPLFWNSNTTWNLLWTLQFEDISN